jgi:hypothetical protein
MIVRKIQKHVKYLGPAEFWQRDRHTETVARVLMDYMSPLSVPIHVSNTLSERSFPVVVRLLQALVQSPLQSPHMTLIDTA